MAPFGEINIERESEVKGVLIAQWISIGTKVTLTLDSPLFPPISDGGIVHDARKDAGQTQDIPYIVHDLLMADRPIDVSVILPDTVIPDANRDSLVHPDVAIPDGNRDVLVLPDAPAGTAIGPEGGTILSSDHQAELEIPVGALSSTITFYITPVSDSPTGNVDNAYEIKPAGTVFSKPATLRITFDPEALDEIPEETLGLGMVVNDAWQAVPYSTVDITKHQVTGFIDKVGTYGALPSTCGDGIISGLEVCDGSNLHGQTCLTLGFTGGTLFCNANCTLDLSGCTSCIPMTCQTKGKNCGTISDGCGGTLNCGACPNGEICGWGGAANVCGNIPPDPATLAPPIDTSVATTIQNAYQFLYTGDHPIQAGVGLNVIEARRASVIN